SSIVPEHVDRDTYLVLNDYGSLGRAWCETSEGDTDRGTLMRDPVEGQFSSPVRIVAFNAAQGWSRDVTDEIASELRQQCANRGEVPTSLQDFLEERGR